MKARVPALFLAAAAAAFGAGRDFDRVVNAIEHYYGVKHTHIPLLGAANLFAKVARPAGTRGFKLAVFDNLPGVPDDGGQRDLDRFMNDLCRGGLRPLVVTHSRAGAESSYILAGETGKSTSLLIATFERDRATVVEVEIDLPVLFRMLASPVEAHRLFGPANDDDQ